MSHTEGKGGRSEGSPSKKQAKMDGGGGDDEMGSKGDKLEVMMEKMMTMMTDMKSDMKNEMTGMKAELKSDVSDLKGAVKEATDAAKGAEGKANLISKEDMRRMESTIENASAVAEAAKGKVDALQTMVDGMRGGSWSSRVASGNQNTTHGKGKQGSGGNAAGKGASDMDKRTRTLYFGNFDKDEDEETIINFVKQWTQEVSG